MKRTRNYIRSNTFISLLFPILTLICVGFISILSSFYDPAWIYNWENIRPDIIDSVKSIRYTYIDNKKNTPRWIIQNATISELIKLSDYPNGNVKAIAYEGLVRKHDFLPKTDIILRAINDTTYSMYYLDLEMEIGTYIVDYVLGINENIPPPPPQQYDFEISEEDKRIILKEYFKRTPLQLFRS